MKKFIRRLGAIAIALMVGALGASAQSWTGNAPQAGDFYLYNVGSGKFLTSGAWWGTHAALDYDGMKVTLAGTNGEYTISTAIAFAGKYLGDNAYMDNGTAATWVFTQVTPGVYTMKNGNNYLVYTSGCVADLTTTTPTTDAGYWQLVTRQQLIDNLKNATPTSPIEASFYMNNPKNRRNWKDSKPFSGDGFSDNGSFNASADGLYTGGCTSVGQYHKTFDNYQALTDLPNGKYSVTVKGNYAAPESGWEAIPYLYANSEKTNLKPLGDISGFAGSNDAERNTRALVDDTYLTDAIEVIITDGNLRVGVKSDANMNWCTWREFTIKFLSPQLSFAAEPLPANGDMAAGQWYYIDIPAAADNYQATATTLANIVYTTDGTILRENESSVTAHFTAADNSLSATRYYVKSSTANNLVVEAAAYTYEVGTATSSHAYVQGGETVTISWAGASTNDPGASFAKNGNPTITFGGNTVSVTPTSNGFTFTVPAVAAGTDYTLSIPANAFGYAAGSTYNAEQNITIHTPAVFDGIYYLKTSSNKYVGRGSSYGTRACINDFGLPLNIATNAITGVTTIQYYDTELYLYVTNDRTAIYADNSTNNGWTITSTGNGTYNIQSTYAIAENDANTYLNLDGLNLALSNSPYAWTIQNGAAHKAQMTANKNSQAATAATAAGIQSVTTVDELETAVASWATSYVIAPTEVNATPSESYQPFYNWQATLTTYTADVTIPAAGLYKLTMQGFGRLASNEKVYALQQQDADVSPFYAFFGDVTIPLMSVMDLGSNSTNYANDCVQHGGNYYPNGKPGALAAFQDNKYENTIWVYIPEAGTYSYGIKIDGCASVNNFRWCCYTTQSISLTLYSSDHWPILQQALLDYAPYNDILAANDATGYTTAYNTYAAYTQSTPQSDMLAAINYMQNNYSNYQWANASIAHPVDVTEGIIRGWECTANDAWPGDGRTTATGTYYNGTNRTYFTQNHENGAARSQDVTIPEIGAYLLRTIVRPVADASYANITIGSESTTTRGIQTGSANIGNGWAYNDIYFATTSDNESKTISINLSNVNLSREADCGEMHLLYIGQNADFVKDGVHKYIGSFSTATTLTPTDAAPIVDVTAATFTTSTSVDRNSNPNGLVYATANQTNVNAGINIVKGTSCNSLVLADGHPFVNSKEFTASDASYTLSAIADDGTGNKFATLVLPFNATTLAGTAYALNQGVSIATEEIRGTVVTAITANQPVLVRAAGTYRNNSSVTIPVINAGATFTNGELVGTFSPLAAPVGSYVLQSHSSRVAFYLVGDTRPTVNPFRAYIRPQAAAANKFSILFDDNEVTAIDAVDADFGSDAEIFTANGTRIHALRRGLNIVKMSDGTVSKIMVK